MAGRVDYLQQTVGMVDHLVEDGFTQITRAASDYNDNTDITVKYCDSPCSSGNIPHYEIGHGKTTRVASIRTSVSQFG